MKFPHPLYILLFTATATFAVNGFLVYKAVSAKRDLVTSDYYRESLQYDDWRSQRENARKRGLEFILNKVDEKWRVSVKREGTAEDAGSTVFGSALQPDVFQQASLRFYRPGDQNLDHEVNLHLEGHNLVADVRPLAPGAWRVTLSLQLEDTRLAQDFELML